MNQQKTIFSFLVFLLSDFQKSFMPAFERKSASKQCRHPWTLSKILPPLMMTANEGNLCDVLKRQCLGYINNCAKSETKRLPVEKLFEQYTFEIINKILSIF